MATIYDNISNNADHFYPRPELHSHASMVLLGKHAYIFDRTPPKSCDVLPFDPSIGKSSEVPIIDGAVAYDCPHTHKTFSLYSEMHYIYLRWT